MSPRFSGADARLKAAGAAIYTVDVTLPRMLHARVLRSDYPHATIRGIDVAAARSLPGVRTVLTAADLPTSARNRRVLAADRVVSRADAVAAIAADSEEIASRALDLIRVEYEPLPAVSDLDSAIDPASPTIFPGHRVAALPPERAESINNVSSYGRISVGDVARGFAESDVIVEEEYRTPSVNQVSLEPRASVAMVEPDGRIVVWASSQGPFALRAALADVLGVPATRVAVRTGLVGGGFGGKIAMHAEPLAVLLAMATGRPVRLVNTRYEEFRSGYARPATIIRVKTGAKSDGTLVARQVTAFSDGGCIGSGAGARLPLLTLGPYRIPNVLAEDYEVFTNSIPPGAFRAPGATPSVFAGESNMDGVARALGMDPVALRLKNLLHEGELSPTGQVIVNAPLAEALQTAARRIGWNDPRAANVGRGIALGWWQSGPGNSTVLLMLNADGSVQLLTGAMDQGPGSAMSGLPLIVGADLGIPPERVEVVLAGTDYGPQDAGSSGSKVTVNLGIAAHRAALDVKRQLIERAAVHLDAPAERLLLADGAVSDPTSGARVTLSRLALQAYAEGQIVGRGSCATALPPFDRSRCVGNIWPVMANPSFFAQAAEVAVDPETGQVRVQRVAVAQDVGFAVNRQAIEGQIEGGVMQGIGQAVYEELTLREGRITNPNLRDYAVPSALDAPRFLVDIIESRLAEGVDGVKGVGEAPTCATPAAVANAVLDAAGARVRELPLSGEHVLAALDES